MPPNPLNTAQGFAMRSVSRDMQISKSEKNICSLPNPGDAPADQIVAGLLTYLSYNTLHDALNVYSNVTN